MLLSDFATEDSSTRRTVPDWAIVWRSTTLQISMMLKWEWCVAESTQRATTAVCPSTGALTTFVTYQTRSTGDCMVSTALSTKFVQLYVIEYQLCNSLKLHIDITDIRNNLHVILDGNTSHCKICCIDAD